LGKSLKREFLETLFAIAQKINQGRSASPAYALNREDGSLTIEIKLADIMRAATPAACARL
jgi:hypothetical protein